MKINIVLSVIIALGLCACAKKPRAQGNFSAAECKTICNNGDCTTRCISADGSFR